MDKLNQNCPICDGEIEIKDDTVVSEIITCPDCKSRLVVDSISKNQINLSKAPEVEEDWGQ